MSAIKSSSIISKFPPKQTNRPGDAARLRPHLPPVLLSHSLQVHGGRVQGRGRRPSIGQVSRGHVAADGGAGGGAGAGVAPVVVVRGGLAHAAAGLDGHLRQADLVRVAVVHVAAAHL